METETQDLLPEAPLQLEGFPQCHFCDREARDGTLCVMHGGQPLDLAAVRRSIHRQIRRAIQEMVDCRRCLHLALIENRCQKCSWFRGAAMGICGIAEQLGWSEEMSGYMELIAVHGRINTRFGTRGLEYD